MIIKENAEIDEQTKWYYFESSLDDDDEAEIERNWRTKQGFRWDLTKN